MGLLEDAVTYHCFHIYFMSLLAAEAKRRFHLFNHFRAFWFITLRCFQNLLIFCTSSQLETNHKKCPICVLALFYLRCCPLLAPWGIFYFRVSHPKIMINLLVNDCSFHTLMDNEESKLMYCVHLFIFILFQYISIQQFLSDLSILSLLLSFFFNFQRSHEISRGEEVMCSDEWNSCCEFWCENV